MTSTGRVHPRFWPWALLYAALTLALLSPLTFRMDHRLPDDSDALQNFWIVWWGAAHLQLGYSGIYEANGYYPNPLPLVYSELQFSQALLSCPLFNGVDNHVLAYNLLVALSFDLPPSARVCFSASSWSPRLRFQRL